MQIDGPHFFALRHFNQRFHMALLAVNTAVSEKPHQVKPASLSSGRSQGIQKNLVVMKLALVDVLVNQGKVLINDPAGAENHVAYFRVAHLTVRKADV